MPAPLGDERDALIAVPRPLFEAEQSVYL